MDTPPAREGKGVGFYSRFFEHPWLNDEARRFLFEERKLDPRVIRWCRLTSWKDKKGVPWLQIPYYNREGQLVGMQNRNLVKGALPRFRFPPNSQCGIYNLPVLNLLKPGDQLFITEGASDCWAMLSAGHKAIAIPSAALLTKADKELLKELHSRTGGVGGGSFHMYPDRDAPGERLFLELQKVLPSLVHHQLPPDCKDFSEYYLKKITT
jgi:DNA primase